MMGPLGNGPGSLPESRIPALGRSREARRPRHPGSSSENATQPFLAARSTAGPERSPPRAPPRQAPSISDQTPPPTTRRIRHGAPGRLATGPARPEGLQVTLAARAQVRQTREVHTAPVTRVSNPPRAQRKDKTKDSREEALHEKVESDAAHTWAFCPGGVFYSSPLKCLGSAFPAAGEPSGSGGSLVKVGLLEDVPGGGVSCQVLKGNSHPGWGEDAERRPTLNQAPSSPSLHTAFPKCQNRGKTQRSE
nr:uncharacterized protein LOC105879456 [Microcebus murinus]